MAVVGSEILAQVDQESFGPESVAEHLGFFPEVFSYLKNRNSDMGRTRPVVTFASAVTVWAFRQYGDPVRELPREMLENLWERISQGGMGERLSGFVEQMEPHMWGFFLEMASAASRREEWERADIAVSGLVYTPVLTSCIYAFWPEEEFSLLEEGLSRFGLQGG